MFFAIVALLQGQILHSFFCFLSLNSGLNVINNFKAFTTHLKLPRSHY